MRSCSRLVAASLALVACTNPYATPSCADGIDNDGDGLTDLADPDCASATSDTEGRGGLDAGRRDASTSDGGRDGGRDAGARDAGANDAAASDAGEGDAGGRDAGGVCALGATPPGQCEAERMPMMCDASCVDVAIDHERCGRCDNPCAATQFCLRGRCVGCPESVCGDRCTRPSDDPLACGGTCGGPACPGDQACSGGSCVAGPEGARCTNPVELTIGTRSVPLGRGAIFGVAIPTCVPAGVRSTGSAVVRFTADRDGFATVHASGRPSEGLLLQRYLDPQCYCADALGTACHAANGDTAITIGVRSGEAVRLLVATSHPSPQPLDLTLSYP
ncbi:MAG: hypothetical protein AB7S26_30895 [Sandaracinaceae bacterium]